MLELTLEGLVTVGGGNGKDGGVIFVMKEDSVKQDCEDNDTKPDSNTQSMTTVDRARATSSNNGTSKVLEKVKRLVMKDRDLLEKGTKAYTSYIRAYKEHKCSFIFR